MTELIWEGKYKDGKKVAPIRIPLPFQTIETVNESTEDRKKTIDLFASGKPTKWRNRLIWGDKKYVLPSLLPEFAGKVNLIYIDPPFNVGADFSYTATIPDNPETDEDETSSFVKEPSIIEQKAYRDTWGRGLDSYLQWFYETVHLLRDLLSDDGCIAVHLDWHIGHYAKSVLDEVFGYSSFINEIIWQKLRSVKSQSQFFANMHDTILVYSRTGNYRYNPQFVEKDQKLLTTHYRHTDEATGKRYNLDNFTQVGQGPPRRFGKKTLAPPAGKHWIWSQERIDEAMANDMIVFSKSGIPYIKRFFDDTEGTRVGDIWTDINPVNQVAKERVDYPTQKPESLLERTILAFTNESDIVLDCFCGSGTTPAVAERLNRRWIACDLGRFSIHTTRKRLLRIDNLHPFIVQNLGKYERQAWQKSEFHHTDNRPAQERSYRGFILDLYRAEPVKGFLWLHGRRGKRMVHIGAVDAPISLGDVKAIIQEFWKSVGKATDINTNGVDILGWEFAFDINETAKQQAIASKVDIKFKKIPREVLDQKAVDAGDIKFFELAGLDVKPKTTGKSLRLSLNDFIIPPDDVPDEVRSAITHWSQWIDYWAVDWDYKDDTFHNEWQTYRTKKEPKLLLEATHEYERKGSYTVVVKVIDILGNDTTKAINVKVG